VVEAMKVLVTGATGHLGANLVRRLLDDGEAIRVLLRQGSDTAAVDGIDVERAWGDLRDPSAVAAAVRGCHRVYHCAARVSTASSGEQVIYDCNVLGTRHLLRAALDAGVGRVVVTGSFSAVGHDPARPSDEAVPFYPFGKVLPYAFSKMLVEHECLSAAAEGLDVVVATSCAIIGPNDFKPSRMGRVLADFARGRLRAYIPGGFEFVAARDIVEVMGLFERVTGRPRPRLRLPPPVMAALAEVTSWIGRRLRPGSEPRFTPGAVRLLRMQRRADCRKARSELGYRPTTIEQAVREAYDWFVRRGVIAAPARQR